MHKADERVSLADLEALTPDLSAASHHSLGICRLTLGELARALTGIKRLARFRADAFDIFDGSAKGFWTSFWVAAGVFPVWCLMIADQMSRISHPSPIRYFGFQAIGYAISWLAYPLAMVRISDFLGRWPQYYGYMVAYKLVSVASGGGLAAPGAFDRRRGASGPGRHDLAGHPWRADHLQLVHRAPRTTMWTAWRRAPW